MWRGARSTPGATAIKKNLESHPPRAKLEDKGIVNIRHVPVECHHAIYLHAASGFFLVGSLHAYAPFVSQKMPENKQKKTKLEDEKPQGLQPCLDAYIP